MWKRDEAVKPTGSAAPGPAPEKPVASPPPAAGIDFTGTPLSLADALIEGAEDVAAAVGGRGGGVGIVVVAQHVAIAARTDLADSADGSDRIRLPHRLDQPCGKP